MPCSGRQATAYTVPVAVLTFKVIQGEMIFMSFESQYANPENRSNWASAVSLGLWTFNHRYNLFSVE